MKRLMLLAICAAAAAMLGCVPSFHPLFADKELIVDPALLGTWIKAKPEEKFVFSRADGHFYEIAITDEHGVTAKLQGRLGRLGNELVLDTTVEGVPEVKNSYETFHLWPMHLFTRIKVVGDRMTFATLNAEWVQSLIQKKEFPLSYQTMENTVLLTASTPDLQAFVARHLATPEAWQSPQELLRKK